MLATAKSGRDESRGTSVGQVQQLQSLGSLRIKTLFVPPNPNEADMDGVEPGLPGLVGDVVQVELGVGPDS